MNAQQQATTEAEEKKSPARYLVPALALLILVALLFQAIVEGQRHNQGKSAKGKPAPAFAMERYTGGTVLSDDLRDKVVMLDFWATWCPPCVQEMPHLTKLAKEYEKDGLVFLAANRDDPELARYEVKRFVDRTVTDLGPYVTFAEDVTAGEFGVSSLPTLYFIDRQGQIHSSFVGFAPEQELRRRIEAALGK